MKSAYKIMAFILFLITVLSLSACGDGSPNSSDHSTPNTRHEHAYEATVVEPTKTENGYTEYTCAGCNDSYIGDVTYAIGSEGLVFEINADEKTCTLTSIGTCTDSDVYIPDYYNGCAVTKIQDRAFAGSTDQVSSVRLPSTLEDVRIENIASLRKTKTVYYDAAVSDNDHIQHPRQRRLMSLDGIENVVFNGVKVPKYACYDCDNIKNIIIGENVTLIGIFTFAECNGITEIFIPANVKTICYGAFAYCSNLKSVTISEGVTEIEGDAFLYCTEISEITLPESLEKLHNGSFMGCAKLQTLTVPSKVEVVGGHLVQGCTSLTEINLPASIRAIDAEAFKDCTSLVTINFAGTMEQWEAIKKYEGWDSGTGNYIVVCSDGSINK